MTNNLESAFVLLPLFAFLGCWTAFWRGMKEWRASFLIAGALWGVWVVATTELLSLRSLFTRGAVASSWLLACISGLDVCNYAIKTAGVLTPSVEPTGVSTGR